VLKTKQRDCLSEELQGLPKVIDIHRPILLPPCTIKAVVRYVKDRE
jgi:hypothetical protein